jgi:hypothetical protein
VEPKLINLIQIQIFQRVQLADFVSQKLHAPFIRIYHVGILLLCLLPQHVAYLLLLGILLAHRAAVLVMGMPS